ncbi:MULTISPECIES: hypothetical protein [unclassified Corynebacterium]|uniref:hypothetical protein n=1 Tax=unclassified Corynebacterium TaxID=2624378 RepID=UPI0021AA5980|nr:MULTISPECIES: hypothetical protein [unclassified Corynebacterium]MCT1452128.1 hypothetical protein [Corynebacterium sp. p3-SID1145]MCT1461830.1 hypothetical protein [Corynebacterium sp. p3-SID1140]MDN8595237.1 hypothetical protein [Corynebacterium sp. P4_F2]WKK55364.1 hypothetical protein QYR03_09230 [Corynebacterium sp. P4-C1]WKK62772.1 hypothetical protein QYR04_07925 [Corynebacterium sp. P8-C1]
MDENGTARTNANDYLTRTLGANHNDVLAVSNRLSHGATITCIENKFSDFGGPGEVRSIIEENVAAARLKRAEKTVPAILREWRRANSDDKDASSDLSSGLFAQSGGDLADMLASLLGGFEPASTASRDTSEGLAQIQKLRTLREEIANASNDYERDIRQSEYNKAAKAFNENAMKDIRAKAEEGDAWAIAATIVSLGPHAVSENDNTEYKAIYDALLGVSNESAR